MNNYLSSNKITVNSDFDISSYIGTKLNPTILINSETKRENNIMRNISQKERLIFRLYNKGLGKNFLNKKPNSVISFEKNFKNYLLSHDRKFLNSIPYFKNRNKNITKKINNLSFHKQISIGSMVYYSLNDKKNKNVIYSTSFKKTYLENSKNFVSLPSKDIINHDFYKVKYLEKNAKRIGKILLNKLIDKKPQNDNKNCLRGNMFINTDIHNNISHTFNNKNYLYNDNLKTLSYQDNNSDIDEKENSSSENNKICILSYNDKNNQTFKNLTKKKIHEKPKKNKNCISVKILKTLKNNVSKNNDIFTYTTSTSHSPLNTSITNKNNFSRYHKNNLNINLYRSNSNIKLFKNVKDKYNINMLKTKSKSRNVVNIDFIKKKSSLYKTNINNNINNLDNYTKGCNSKLLNLVKKNQTNKNKYLKKSLNNEDKEIKKILSNQNEKDNSDYIKNKFKEEKLNKIKILIKNTCLDYDIRKILKEKIKSDKIDKNSDNIFRKHNMLLDNIIFGNDENGKYSGNLQLINDSDKKKSIINKKMNKLRETIKNNNNRKNYLLYYSKYCDWNYCRLFLYSRK